MMVFRLPAVISVAAILVTGISAYGNSADAYNETDNGKPDIAMEIRSEDIDWSCFDQSDGGQLHSDGFCIWQGRSVPGDGCASYYMSHYYTDWGKQISSLELGDIITVDGWAYEVEDVTPLWYSDEQWIFDYCVPQCYDGSGGDGVFLQTCIHNEYGDIVIVYARPCYDCDVNGSVETPIANDILDANDSRGLIEEWGN